MIGYKCKRAIRNTPWCIWRHVNTRAIKLYSRHTSSKINSGSTELDFWNSSAWLIVLSEQEVCYSSEYSCLFYICATSVRKLLPTFQTLGLVLQQHLCDSINPHTVTHLFRNCLLLQKAGIHYCNHEGLLSCSIVCQFNQFISSQFFFKCGI